MKASLSKSLWCYSVFNYVRKQSLFKVFYMTVYFTHTDREENDNGKQMLTEFVIWTGDVCYW